MVKLKNVSYMFLFFLFFLLCTITESAFAVETVKDEYNSKLSAEELRNLKSPEEYAELVATNMLKTSQEVVAQIREANEKHAPFVVDVVGIGAGANNSQVFSALKQTNSTLKALVLEADTTTGVFDKMGSGFRINTKETPNQSLNFFSVCPLQAKDLNKDNEHFVHAQVIGNLVKMCFFYSQVPIAFSQAVATIEKTHGELNAIARYRITTQTGLLIYANQVVVATGLGQPRISVDDEATRQLIKNEEKRSSDAFNQGNTSYVPGIESVDSYLRRASAKLKKGEDPAVESQGSNVAVVGAGDGGNIAIEALTGIYEKLNPKKRQGANIVWIGRHRHKEDFITQTTQSPDRPYFPEKLKRIRTKRYLPGFTRLFDEGKITTIPGRLRQIRSIQELDEQGNPVTKYMITVLGKSGERTEQKVDRIILAMGYINKAHQLLKKFPGEMEIISADTSDFTLNVPQSNIFPIAAKVPRENIWLVGMTAHKLLIHEGHWQLTPGIGHLELLNTRSATTGRQIARNVESSIMGGRYNPISLDTNESIDVCVSIENTSLDEFKGHECVLQVENKLQTAWFLDQFRMPQGCNTPLEIFIENKEGQYEMTVKGLNHGSAQTLIDHFKESQMFRSVKNLLLNHRSVSIRATPRSEDGTIRTESTTIQYDI